MTCSTESAATADAALMTGNVAQVFVDDSDWSQTLQAVHDCLRPGGWFVFETRRPEARAWEGWDNPEMQVSLPGGGGVMVSRRVTEVALPLVSFESSIVVDGERIRSASTLRFREHAEIERGPMAVGFEVADVRDAPDRPGSELVFIARRV